MKTSKRAQSATSLPRAPGEEAGSRSRRYLVMMAVRIACFALMVLVTPYGWYTWVFALGAVFLPYIAVVLANVGQESKEPGTESPERSLTAAAEPAAPSTPPPTVIRLEEQQRLAPRPPETEP